MRNKSFKIEFKLCVKINNKLKFICCSIWPFQYWQKRIKIFFGRELIYFLAFSRQFTDIKMFDDNYFLFSTNNFEMPSLINTIAIARAVLSLMPPPFVRVQQPKNSWWLLFFLFEILLGIPYCFGKTAPKFRIKK